MKKKVISLMVCIGVIISMVVPVHAFRFPQEFWAPNDAFALAVDAGDNQGIITYGRQLIDILNNCEDAPEKRNALVDRYNKVAHAYEALGDYENGGLFYKALYDYAVQFGDTYLDYIKGAKSKYIQYVPRMSMYTDHGNNLFYGAKNEPLNGVLFGICVNGETRKELEDESLILTYQELGEHLTYYNQDAMSDALMHHDAIEFALNCPHERGDITSITQKEEYLNEISELFGLFPDVKVFLRFAAEFDVWTDMAEPEEYKNAFRYVSKYFKDRNPNVSMVWSPNQVSGYYVNIDDYYPGDEYVDWVGISLYSVPYFRGDKGSSQDNQVFFKAGESADPVIAVEDIIRKYGSRKPIMISESGCGHRLLDSSEDTSSFAVIRLREMLAYLPMVYPQIKAMAYFDVNVDSFAEKYDFRLSSNAALKDVYVTLTKGERYIHNDANNASSISYREVTNNMELDGRFPLSCYVHKYGKNVAEMAYYIDGEMVGRSSNIPYNVDIDSSAYRGEHSIKAVATFTDGTTQEHKVNVKLNGDTNGISVVISGKSIEFDQKPIIENGRTMVPMRAIFEELGASVAWDNNTKTATGIKDGREVKITIGEYAIYVNGTKVDIDTPAMIVGGRTLVPVRAIAEGLDCNVTWDSKTSTVIIQPK